MILSDRAPSLSLEDVMDLEHFENWRFHHRLFLNADWNGDGRADLVRIAQSKRGLRVSLTLASGPETAYAVGSEPAVALDVEEPVLGFEATSLGPDRPAIHLHVEHGSVFVVPK